MDRKEYDRQWKSNRYKQLKESGLCCACGKIQPEDGKSKCKQCLLRSRKNVNKSRKKRELAFRSMGLCRCGKPPREGKKTCNECNESNLRLYRKRKSSGRCTYCKSKSIPGKTRCAACRERILGDNRKLRQEVFEAYGGFKCVCCGESLEILLTIDHINNDGNYHRRTIGRTSVLRWLKDNNYPEGYQVLCFNCNMGKHLNKGICPHQQKEKKE